MELIIFCLSSDTTMSCNHIYFSVVFPVAIGATGSLIIYWCCKPALCRFFSILFSVAFFKK